MSLKSFFLLIILGTIFSWLAWGMVLFNFDPAQIGWLEFASFYASLFLALFGSLLVGMDWFKSKIFRRQLLVFRVRTSVRHGILFSVLLVVWAFLQSQSLVTWWVLLLLVLAITILEFFFISLQRKNLNEFQS